MTIVNAILANAVGQVPVRSEADWALSYYCHHLHENGESHWLSLSSAHVGWQLARTDDTLPGFMYDYRGDEKEANVRTVQQYRAQYITYRRVPGYRTCESAHYNG